MTGWYNSGCPLTCGGECSGLGHKGKACHSNIFKCPVWVSLYPMKPQIYSFIIRTLTKAFDLVSWFLNET